MIDDSPQSDHIHSNSPSIPHSHQEQIIHQMEAYMKDIISKTSLWNGIIWNLKLVLIKPLRIPISRPPNLSPPYIINEEPSSSSLLHLSKEHCEVIDPVISESLKNRMSEYDTHPNIVSDSELLAHSIENSLLRKLTLDHISITECDINTKHYRQKIRSNHHTRGLKKPFTPKIHKKRRQKSNVELRKLDGIAENQAKLTDSWYVGKGRTFPQHHEDRHMEY